MKIVTAVIRPFKLDEICEVLAGLGIGGLTVLEVRGFGGRGHPESYSTDVPAATLVPRVKLEMAVPDELVDDVMEAIISTAQTGRLGDGKIFVTDLEQAVRIRNRESGNDAL